MLNKSFLFVIKVFAIVSLFAQVACSSEKLRQRNNFDNDWKFTLVNDENSWRPEFNDSGWRTLDLPHDWSIEGKFLYYCFLGFVST